MRGYTFHGHVFLMPFFQTIPPVLPNQGGLFKEMKKEDSDSDEDKGDHRERFKSERKMISLVSSSKYSKPIPDSLGKLENEKGCLSKKIKTIYNNVHVQNV